jgi:hypothetical protein
LAGFILSYSGSVTLFVPNRGEFITPWTRFITFQETLGTSERSNPADVANCANETDPTVHIRRGWRDNSLASD